MSCLICSCVWGDFGIYLAAVFLGKLCCDQRDQDSSILALKSSEAFLQLQLLSSCRLIIRVAISRLSALNLLLVDISSAQFNDIVFGYFVCMNRHPGKGLRTLLALGSQIIALSWVF